MSALPACIEVHYVHAWCSQRPEEVARGPGTGLTKILKYYCILGTKLKSSTRRESASGESAPKCQAISPAPLHVLNVIFIPSLIFFIMTLPF